MVNKNKNMVSFTPSSFTPFIYVKKIKKRIPVRKSLRELNRDYIQGSLRGDLYTEFCLPLVAEIGISKETLLSLLRK